jgi:sialate O-acetylesterase
VHLLVDDNDTTWINGTLVGATDGAGAQRSYPIPAALLKPTGNVIVVRDFDTGGNGGIYGDPAALKLSFLGGTDIPLAGQWLFRYSAPLTGLGRYPVAIVGNQNYPTLLFNGMISPIELFTIKGALWYQGESNSQKPLQYRTLLPTMIADWRARWNEGSFPFLIVQIAGWQPGTTWPELRQAQWLTAQTVPNTGIVTTIDIGDQTDIHPRNKQEVGRRLALVAESTVYGKAVVSSGPIYKSADVEGSSIRVSFEQPDNGLVVQGGVPLTGFEIAGSDGKFVPADAKVDGDTVVVSSAQVPAPVAVQYDWSGYPNGNLYNQANLPAFPFKSDEK